MATIFMKKNLSRCFSSRRVELRSDTFTKPTEGMLRAMCAAPVGDDVFDEDPTVNRLQDEMAARFNKEAGLFFPTSTMSNIAALLSHCDKRGSEIIAGSDSHITLYEGGGCATLGGIHNRQIDEDVDGTINIQKIKSYIRDYDVHQPTSKVVCLENTHNVRGGLVLPYQYLNDIGIFCKQNELKLHIDGARIFNAMVYTGKSLESLNDKADSVSMCLSKGLGCPMGAVLVGDEDFIIRAKFARKALGGGMRQAGLMAAAGLHAINDEEGHVQRISLDHSLTQELAKRLKNAGYMLIHDIHTNIIYFGPPKESKYDAISLGQAAEDQFNVYAAGGFYQGTLLRAVVHRDVTPEDIEVAASAFEALLK